MNGMTLSLSSLHPAVTHMEVDMERTDDQVIDLGTASVETKGPVALPGDVTGNQRIGGGISDE